MRLNHQLAAFKAGSPHALLQPGQPCEAKFEELRAAFTGKAAIGRGSRAADVTFPEEIREALPANGEALLVPMATIPGNWRFPPSYVMGRNRTIPSAFVEVNCRTRIEPSFVLEALNVLSKGERDASSKVSDHDVCKSAAEHFRLAAKENLRKVTSR
jgi:hypothetical protein